MTVPKNTKRAKAAIAKAHNVRCYSLSNNFSGEPLAEKPLIWGGEIRNNCYTQLIPVSQSAFLARELNSRNVMLSETNGHYTLHVHSNLWYEFEERAS